jgi:hypothetical protein
VYPLRFRTGVRIWVGVRWGAVCLWVVWRFFLWPWGFWGVHASCSSDSGSESRGSSDSEDGSSGGSCKAVGGCVSVDPRMSSMLGPRKGMWGRRVMLAWPSAL